MKKRVLCTCAIGAGLVMLAVPNVARASDEANGPLGDRGPMTGGTIAAPKSSPQAWVLELRFSPYNPQIDSDPALNGKTPYQDTFGTMPRLLIGLELDYEALRIPHVGVLGPGVAISYTQATDKSFELNGTRSQEDTSIDIIPMYAVAVLRADALYRDLHVPLVPYVKGGLAYAIWRGTNPGGTSEYISADGSVDTSAKGHTWGTHFALGMSFALNVLDPGSARNLDNGTGINTVYLYGEYYVSALNGLGQSAALRVGDNTWAAGMSFEF